MSKGGAVLMVYRTCLKKGDHWPSKCPYKDLAQPSETFVENPNPNPTDSGASGPSKGGAYIPPTMRAGTVRTPVGGADMRCWNNEDSVRINNLSEDTR
ncbi:putative eukaryotic translation initiation factor 3 subunit G [Helianthus debilis subsp. tardiflorus]